MSPFPQRLYRQLHTAILNVLGDAFVFDVNGAHNGVFLPDSNAVAQCVNDANPSNNVGVHRSYILLGFGFVSCFVLAVALVSVASAAGFDCKNRERLSLAEMAICDRPALSKLDDELNIFYKKKLQESQHKQWLQQDQRIWIKERDTDFETCGGTTPTCVDLLKSLYEKRIESLSEHEPCPVADSSPGGVFSGDWVYEEYVDGKRWGKYISFFQLDSKLCGRWIEGLGGGRGSAGLIVGTVGKGRAFIERCEYHSEDSCVGAEKFLARIDGEKLSIFACSSTEKCEAKPEAVLYHVRSKSCINLDLHKLLSTCIAKSK